MNVEEASVMDKMEMPTRSGPLVLALLARLSSEKLPWVYLRNYEKLPEDVGNDVDLLVPKRCRRRVARILMTEADELGWKCVGQGNFSPLALYFAHLPSNQTLHLDLFDRLEWHCLEFADAGVILENRRWNGQVYIPDESDEVYLNVLTRLLYHGQVREKHRSQASSYSGGDEGLRLGFQKHLGSVGAETVDSLVTSAWVPDSGVRPRVLMGAFFRYALKRPASLTRGLLRYAGRVWKKFIMPPGRFIVFEGADGVGKSTVLEEVVPWCKTWCGGRDAYRFHWKPTRVSRQVPEGDGPVDPRGRPLRSRGASLVFLTWHVASFWWGYLRRVRPLLVKSHAVIGDRYSYDIFLDPKRFRLRLPDWVCRWAARLTPKPDLAIALLADPETVRLRKPELSHREIAEYQTRWNYLAQERQHMVGLSADDGPVETAQRTKRVILEAFVE